MGRVRPVRTRPRPESGVRKSRRQPAQGGPQDRPLLRHVEPEILLDEVQQVIRRDARAQNDAGGSLAEAEAGWRR